MLRFFRVFRCGTLAFCLSATGQVAPISTAPSDGAARYLNQVLDLMQAHALHTKEIDWPEVRKQTLARAAGAQTTTDTYVAIAYALTQLKERHSFLKFPVSMPEAENNSISASMNVILVPYKHQFPSRPKSIFKTRSAPTGNLIHLGDVVFAHVVIPTCWQTQPSPSNGGGNYFQNYADSLHAAAATLEASHPLGWIIDLRGNGGGNMYPMLAGIGFVLGEGRLGYFATEGGTEDDWWFYQQGTAGEMDAGRETVYAKITDSPLTLPSLPPVALLIDGGTASSGEATAISFIGRPHTRTFGAHTAGLTTANGGFSLPDGAMLFLSTSIEEDRNHRMYPDGVEPDVVFPQPSVQPAEGADPVLQSAEQWLLSQHER